MSDILSKPILKKSTQQEGSKAQSQSSPAPIRPHPKTSSINSREQTVILRPRPQESEKGEELKGEETLDPESPNKRKRKKKKIIEEAPKVILKPPRIVFNVFHTQYDIIKEAGKKDFNWRLSMKDPWVQGVEWDVLWVDVAPALDRFPKIKPFQKINHFPGMFQIARKNYLARNLKKMKKQFPKDYKFFPTTWLLPYELNELKNQIAIYQKKNQKVNFIVKPECMSQGKGIFITRKVDSIDPSEHLVVQKYMRDPYLIDGYKFDLRIYVLVTNVQPLRIFLYKDGLARFASEPFKLKAFNNPFIHLTNYAINKDNSNFTSDANGESGHKRSLESVYNTLTQDGVDVAKMQKQINEIIVKTLISIQPDLVHNYRTAQPGDIFNNICFEILGFDIILNNKGKPFLLEVNHAPSFNGDTFLDQKVKKGLIYDTFRLLNISIEQKQTVLDILKEVSEQRIIGTQKGNKQLQSIQRQDLYISALKERDAFEVENLGGYTRLYPPIKESAIALQTDSTKMDYYQQFLDYVKNFMMDFKVTRPSNTEAVEETKANKPVGSNGQKNIPRTDKKTIIEGSTKRASELIQQLKLNFNGFSKQSQKSPYMDGRISPNTNISLMESGILFNVQDNPQSAMFEQEEEDRPPRDRRQDLEESVQRALGNSSRSVSQHIKTVQKNIVMLGQDGLVQRGDQAFPPSTNRFSPRDAKKKFNIIKHSQFPHVGALSFDHTPRLEQDKKSIYSGQNPSSFYSQTPIIFQNGPNFGIIDSSPNTKLQSNQTYLTEKLSGNTDHSKSYFFGNKESVPVIAEKVKESSSFLPNLPFQQMNAFQNRQDFVQMTLNQRLQMHSKNQSSTTLQPPRKDDIQTSVPLQQQSEKAIGISQQSQISSKFPQNQTIQFASSNGSNSGIGEKIDKIINRYQYPIMDKKDGIIQVSIQPSSYLESKLGHLKKKDVRMQSQIQLYNKFTSPQKPVFNSKILQAAFMSMETPSMGTAFNQQQLNSSRRQKSQLNISGSSIQKGLNRYQFYSNSNNH